MRQQVHVLFSHEHVMLQGDFMQTQCRLWRQLSKVVPAMNSSDALCGWSGGAGAELVTTQVSQLKLPT